MFAVIQTGGKQYRVSPQDIIKVEKLSFVAGEEAELTEVLAIGGTDNISIGKPLLEGARVAVTVLEHSRNDKIIVFRKQRRKNYRRTKGHRQQQTVLRIEEILQAGEKRTTPAKAKTKVQVAQKKKATTEKKESTVKKVSKPKKVAKKSTKKT